MVKIKDIHERLHKNPGELALLELRVAKRVFSFFAALYFVSFLSTIGGLYFSWMGRETMSMITFHLYSLLVIVSLWFGYALFQNALPADFLPRKKAQIGVASFLIILGIVILYFHISKVI